MKVPFQSNNDWLEYNEATMVQSLDPCAVSWSLWSRCLIRVLNRSFHRCPIKHNMLCELRRGPKGQANLGGSGGMVPWKILKFEVAKDVISCTLGAKQDKNKESFMIIKFDSMLSAGLPFKCMDMTHLAWFWSYFCSLLVAGDAYPWQKWLNEWKLRNQSYFLLSLKLSQLSLIPIIF